METSDYIDILKAKEEFEKIDPSMVDIFVCMCLSATRTYKECEELYQRFVFEVASFMRKNYGFINSLEAAIFVDYLLWSGVLSRTGENVYHDFTYGQDLALGLLGTGAITGKSVCRHMTALVVDILNVDYTACNLCVTLSRNRDAAILNSKIQTCDTVGGYDHAVAGVLYDDIKREKILYDPTHRIFAGAVYDEVGKMDWANRIAYVCGRAASKFDPSLYNNAYILRKGILNLEYNNEDEKRRCNEIGNAMFKHYLWKFNDVYKEVSKVITESQSEINAFSESTKELKERIGELADSLCPKGDEPIKKWLVRK